MGVRILAMTLVGAWASMPALAASDGKPRIANLVTGSADGEMTASFRVVNAFPKETREEIQNGIEVMFTHRIEAVRERKGWRDRKVSERTVLTLVRYDPLTHQYRLIREVEKIGITEWTTDSQKEAEKWMTSLRDIPVGMTAGERGTATFVRVRSEIRERRFLFFIPWNVKTPWAETAVELP